MEPPPPRLVTTFRDRCSHSSRLLLFFFPFSFFFRLLFPLPLFPPFSLYWQVIITSINGGARSIFTRVLSRFLFRFVGNLSRLSTTPKYQRRNELTNERTSVARVIRALTVSLFEALISQGERNYAEDREIITHERIDFRHLVHRSFLLFLVSLSLSLFLLHGTRLFFPSAGVIGYFSSSWEATIIIALRHPCTVLHTYPSWPRVKGESVLNTVNFVAELFGSRYAFLSSRRDRERGRERKKERAAGI